MLSQMTSILSKITNSLFYLDLYEPMAIVECINRKTKQVAYCFHLKWKRFSSTFPLPVKTCCFSIPFELKLRFLLVYSPDSLLSFSGTMKTLKHPVGAPQLGIPRIVLDIFRFHQSKWLQFSIKMLNLVLELRELGRKYEAVLLDDKWPSFDKRSRVIRARVYRETGKD